MSEQDLPEKNIKKKDVPIKKPISEEELRKKNEEWQKKQK